MLVSLRLPYLALLVLSLYIFTGLLSGLPSLHYLHLFDALLSCILLVRYSLNLVLQVVSCLLHPFYLFYSFPSLGSTVFYQPLLVLSASGLGVAGIGDLPPLAVYLRGAEKLTQLQGPCTSEPFFTKFSLS